jgi:hypothetical protein
MKEDSVAAVVGEDSTTKKQQHAILPDECIACLDEIDIERSNVVRCQRCGARTCIACASIWKRGCPVCREKVVWMSKLLNQSFFEIASPNNKNINDSMICVYSCCTYVATFGALLLLVRLFSE